MVLDSQLSSLAKLNAGKMLSPVAINSPADEIAGFIDDGAGTKGIPKINGRYPINSKYAGQVMNLSDDLALKYPNGVKFNSQGFPDFSPYSKANVQIKGLTGNYAIDAAKANQVLGLNGTPSGYVWHHVQNGLTMQLVPKDLHRFVRHTGGAAIIKAGSM